MKGSIQGSSLLNEMIENTDITEAEDLYDYLVDYYTELDDSDQMRLLKDMKTKNPEGYLDDLVLTDQITMINALRDLQTETEQEIIKDNKEYDAVYAGIEKNLPLSYLL